MAVPSINPDDAVIIANPAAQGGYVGRHWDGLLGRVRAILGDLPVERTQHPGHAFALAQRAVWAGKKVLLSLGGDGTHGEVVAGVAKTNPWPGSIVVGVLPCGTGGDFRKVVEGGGDLEEHARRLLTGEPREIDVGRIEITTLDGEQEERLFLNEASFGMSGAVCEKVNQSSKWLGGQLTYFSATIRSLPRYEPPLVRILVDGQEVGDFPVNTVMISNGRWAGGGMLLAPQARLADAMLDVCIIEARGVFRMVTLSPSLYNGRVDKSPLVHRFRGFSIEAQMLRGRPPLVEADGDVVGTLPLKASVLPGAVGLIGVKKEFL